MLKGLKKIKNNQDTLTAQSNWRKDDLDSIDKQQNKEQNLNQLCTEVWNEFTSGKKLKAGQLCQKLFIKQDQFFEDIFRQHASHNQQDQQIEQVKLFENPLEYSRKAIQQEKRENQHMHNYDQTAVDFFNKYKNVYDLDELNDQEYEENQVENTKMNKKQEKMVEKNDKKQQKLKQVFQKKVDKSLSTCNYCINNGKIQSEQIISLGQFTALILNHTQKYENIFHAYILPFDHYQSQIELDEDIFEEIRNFQKCLINCFDQKDYEVIFVENAANLQKMPHLIIECIALPRNSIAELCVYFKQAIENMESEWNTHRKIYTITKEQGGIQKQIPKGFPYFYVDFNMKFGYAHIIEQENKFSKDFAHEVICEILGLEKYKVLNAQRSTKSQLEFIKNQFKAIWNVYDWTQLL